MSRWGKNIVVPLDSLCKEKENTNRPTVARSVGTVGKWGKMGFTSTRTYALSGLPAAVAAAAAAAAAASPAQSPASAAMDDDMSPTVPEPPKPKKFFKSRNAAPPEVIAQIIQQLPRTPTSPMGVDLAVASISGTSMQGREPIKLKIAKGNSVERKKKTPKKSLKPGKTSAATEGLEENAVAKAVAEPKPKKKKEEKKLKPEAAPSRIISRARKTVNYCEYDEDERMPTPSRDILIPKTKVAPVEDLPQTPPAETAVSSANDPEPVLPPPAAPPFPTMTTAAVLPPVCPASKTPEHPPIVLRISKGTSRLVSTDSEDHPTSSPQHDSAELMKSRQVSVAVEEVPAIAAITALPTTPKIIVKPPKPPSPEPPPPLLNENNEINYCTVKISPDKPPKERLKLIIKTDYIRNAVAKAAAAEKSAAAEAKLLCGDGCERPEKEKKQKSKKHKHPKHAAVEQLTPAHTGGSEFKTPSPHLALGNSGEHQQALARTVISPPALSERDFDSQSSVLGSISSKGNSTPQPLAQAVQEESCVIHSRGSSVITSDLETSQHSSLVAPPSDIESRLESMMMDGDVSTQRATNTNLVEEPLQEDILAVLRGDESQACVAVEVKVNGTTEKEVENTVEQQEQEPSKRRVTRGRTRGTTKTTYDANDEEEPAPTQKTPNKTRGRKAAAVEVQSQAAEEELLPTVGKRTTRRGVKKTEEAASVSLAMLVDESEKSTPTKCIENEASTPTSASPPAPAAARRGRPPRNAVNNNSLSNNNNNINKIAASLSAKAGAAEEAKIVATTATALPVVNSQPAQRSYGRKRKNQEVTQVLQPSVEDLEEQHPTPAKLHNIGSPTAAASASYSPCSPQAQSQTPTLDLHDANSNSNSLTRPPSTTPSSPPRRDYKIKDKFKRTLTLDNQVNCNAVLASSPTAQLACDNAPGATASGAEEELQQQRGSVKLVISKKKGSIFKSRALVPAAQTEQSGAAKRHLYKHRWEANGGTGDDTNASPNAKDAAQASAAARTTADKVFDDFSEELSTVGGLANARDNSSPAQGKFTRVIKANPQAAPSVDAAAEAPRNTVTRVRNVKTAHQIQEIGEYQEMDDDVAYILDALQPHNPTPTRCLSALQLATKCMTPTFRMHVRAHGVVTEFFKALSDANTDLSLGLCTSAIMYILSQEGLNMDLDRDSLELMINLLEAEGVAAPLDRANYERNRQKVRELCEEIKAQGKATHLNVDSITVGTLAMETLLSLTSKRAGEWFKEELRELGGLEHIIKTISECCRPLIECDSAVAWTQSLVDNMQTVARCMRVLENVTQMNEENQKYMLTYVQGAAVDTLCNLYCVCNRELMIHPNAETSSKDDPGNVVRELLIPLMKVLINLTHTFNPTNAMGAELLGQRADVIEISFQLLLAAPNYIPDRCVFELSILVLLFLINLSMYTIPNRALIMKAFAPAEYVEKCTPKGGVEQQSRMTTIQAIMEYFYKCEELARLVEKNTDAILESNDKNKKKQEEVDETVNNLLQKAGHHMEHTLKGSYAAILIGHLINDSEEYENLVRSHLRGNGFKEIVSVLEKYYTFMNLTASSEAAVVAHIKSTKKLMDYFKKRDSIYEMNAEANDSGLPLNLEIHHALASGSSGSTSTTPSTEIAEIAHSSVAGATTTTRSTTQRVYKTYSQR